jgi:glycosyltransferase involved in cell wall biosynthesis
MRNILLIGQLTDISGYGNAARSYFLSLLELEKQGLINLKILNYPCENKIRETLEGEQLGEDIEPEIFNLVQQKNILSRLYTSNLLETSIEKSQGEGSISINLGEESCKFIKEGYDIIFFLLNNWLYSPYPPHLWEQMPLPKINNFSHDENYNSIWPIIKLGEYATINTWAFAQEADAIYPCFVWETDRCPDFFVEAWKRTKNVKKIISACDWNKEAVIKDKRTTFGSETVPYTINLQKEYCNTMLGKLKQITDHTEFVFCSVAQWSHRKGFDILLKAYFMEFYNDNVTLLLKTYIDVDPEKNKTQSQMFQQIISNIKNNIHHNGKHIEFKCKVAIIPTFMSKKEINSIYKASDAYVTTTRGEGFGLPIAEFLQFEKPVIVPDKGGHLDFCHLDNFFIKSSYEPCEHMPQNPGLYSAEQNYVECSLRSTREKMRECYEMYKNNPKKFADLSQTSYNHFVNYLSAENCANLMKKAIDIEE